MKQKRQVRTTPVLLLLIAFMLGVNVNQAVIYNKQLKKQKIEYTQKIDAITQSHSKTLNELKVKNDIKQKQLDQQDTQIKQLKTALKTSKSTNITISNSQYKKLPHKHIGSFVLSWYSPKELGKQYAHQLHTSTGTIPKAGRTIAVDPKVIPYGSIVYIENHGYYVAEDCGGAIKQNRIDVFTDSYDYAIQQGKKTANVYIVQKNSV